MGNFVGKKSSVAMDKFLSPQSFRNRQNGDKSPHLATLETKKIASPCSRRFFRRLAKINVQFQLFCGGFPSKSADYFNVYFGLRLEQTLLKGKAYAKRANAKTVVNFEDKTVFPLSLIHI